MRGQFAQDIVGQRFGRLVVKTRAGRKGSKALWLCGCDCGADHTVAGQYLRQGKSRSCGCLQREETAARRLVHGGTTKAARWPEWGVWRQMIVRCTRKADLKFPYYGGRGIAVCERWKKGESGLTGFQCFIADMGRRPEPALQIDRRDNDGNYEPANCHWATAKQQAANRRARGTALPNANDNHPQTEAA